MSDYHKQINMKTWSKFYLFLIRIRFLDFQGDYLQVEVDNQISKVIKTFDFFFLNWLMSCKTFFKKIFKSIWKDSQNIYYCVRCLLTRFHFYFQP